MSRHELDTRLWGQPGFWKRLRTRVPLRLTTAWNVLRGRPTCYRMSIVRGSIRVDKPHTLIAETVSIDTDTGIRVESEALKNLSFSSGEVGT